MNLPFYIRPATEEDVSEILRLLVETKIADKMAGDLSDYLVACDSDGKIIGTAGIQGIEGSSLIQSDVVLVNVAVEKPYRKQGVASFLIDVQVSRCKKLGAKTISLCTMYYQYRFFKKRGWVITKRADLPDPINTYWQFTDKRYKKCGCMVRVL